MSMISAQCDELRVMAQLEKSLERPAIARILSDAADTIWQLRDDLQRANEAVRDAEHDESRAWDRVRKAEAESAKLRELLRDMLMSPQEYCEKYGIEYEGWSSADDHIDDRMRELGVMCE